MTDLKVVTITGPAVIGYLRFTPTVADVVKIEPRAGDLGRLFGPMLGLGFDTNPPFELDNRSKRSTRHCRSPAYFSYS